METEKCPNCGGTLVLRTNKHTGEVFWGCGNFPNCRYSRSLESQPCSSGGYCREDSWRRNEPAHEPVREEHKPRQFYIYDHATGERRKVREINDDGWGGSPYLRVENPDGEMCSVVPVDEDEDCG